MNAALTSLRPDAAAMLYGRVLRPPRLDWNGHDYTGMHLAWHDAASLADVPGIVKLVVRGDFIGVVATEDRYALQAIAQLRVRWKAHETSLQSLPAEQPRRTVYEHGDIAGAFDTSSSITERSYSWTAEGVLPDAGHPMLTAIADCAAVGARLWTASKISAVVRQQIAVLIGMPASMVQSEVAYFDEDYPASEPDLTGMQTGQDAAADAALLSAAAGRPVCVTLLPEQIGIMTQRMVAQIEAKIDTETSGSVLAYRHTAHAVGGYLPPLALMLAGIADPVSDVASAAGTRYDAQLPPYAYINVQLARQGLPGAAGDYSAAHVFAHESFIDEAARQVGADTVQYRLQHVQDERGAALIRAVARQADWTGTTAEKKNDGNILRGRGFAYARVIEDDGKTGALRQWSAWVADVEYNRDSGDLSVTRVVVGQDVAEAGVGMQPGDFLRVEDESVRSNAQLAMRGLLSTENSFDTWAKQEYGISVQAAAQTSLPAVEVVGLPAAKNGSVPGPVRLSANAAFSLPAAAAVANAIHDATGIRLRSAPFSSEQLRLALGDNKTAKRRTIGWKGGIFGGVAATLAGLFVLASPWRGEIKPVAAPDPGLYSAATIARGKLVAAAGDCVVCHTAPNGVPNAGGHALETPFGTVYSTNITPDEKTGIGNWSFAAFERAMREGIHRDGRHLYPAFPYTAFARISDADMQALYAYLMAQEPVAFAPPETRLAFPFGMRPLMAGWNLLFHKNEQFVADTSRSAQWNRGAYLVEGAGHCSACHSPRNMLGAEKGGRAYLTGGSADGWEAPALTALSRAPVPWSEAELFSYLRTGFSPLHGVAAGPMAPVVAELAQLPADDVRAIAHYLASFNEPVPQSESKTKVAVATAHTQTVASVMGANLYRGSCAVCHQGDTGPTLFGVKPSLSLNTNVHSAAPDNLIRVILQGIREPANPELGYMPGFADSFNDEQMVELLKYLRANFAADKPAWPDLKADVARIREAGKAAALTH